MFKAIYNWLCRKPVKSTEKDQESIPPAPKLKIDDEVIISNNFPIPNGNCGIFNPKTKGNPFLNNNQSQNNILPDTVNSRISINPFINSSINNFQIKNVINIKSEPYNQQLSPIIVHNSQNIEKVDLNSNFSIYKKSDQSLEKIPDSIFRSENSISISRLSLYKNENSSISNNNPNESIQKNLNAKMNNEVIDSDYKELNKTFFQELINFNSASPSFLSERLNNTVIEDINLKRGIEINDQNSIQDKPEMNPLISKTSNQIYLKEHSKNMNQKIHIVSGLDIAPPLSNLAIHDNLSRSQICVYTDSILKAIEKLKKFKTKISMIIDVNILTNNEFMFCSNLTKSKANEKNYPTLTQEMFLKVYQFVSSQYEIHSDLLLEDMRSLIYKEVVSDNIINKYLKLISKRCEESTFIFNIEDFEMFRLKQKKFHELILREDQLSRIDLQVYKRVIIPIKRNKNFRPAFIVNIENSIMEYYDSMDLDMTEETNEFILIKKFVELYLGEEYLRKCKWKLIKKPCPRQESLVDCGIFLLMNIDYLSLNLEPNYLPGDCNYFRYLILISLLERKLLTS